MRKSSTAQSLIDGLIADTGAPDAESAIRLKVRDVIARYEATFGGATIPVNINALASFLGIMLVDQPPGHSKDAELAPRDDGTVVIRVNRERSDNRQRFSVGHEVSHTFFPNYETRIWCRGNGRERRRDKPEDVIEMLCDIGSAELLMPRARFHRDAAAVASSQDLVALAAKYGVSREAALRRLAEMDTRAVAAAFFSWKFKPSERESRGTPARKLRVDYTIASQAFAAAGHFIPHDKSVGCEGPLYRASATGQACDGDCILDLGSEKGLYRVLAVPIWTDEEHLGPRGETAVGAILEPVDVIGRTTQRASV
jgi:Zn-dependent peptidase ImmA (M78 family)